MRTVTETLQAGRDFLLENKWGQGALHTESDGYCARGALYYGSGFESTSRYIKASDLLDAAAKALFPERVGFDTHEIEGEAPQGAAVVFNDHDDTTLNDVLAVFDAAILWAKEAEGR